MVNDIGGPPGNGDRPFPISYRTAYRPLDAARRSGPVAATLVQRGGALLFDLFVAFVAVPVPVQSFLVLTGQSTVACRWTSSGEECVLDPDDARLSRILFWTVAILFVLAFSWAVSKRCTLGQKATGTLVVDATTNQRVPFARALLRTVAMIAGALPLGLGYLWALWDRDRRTWHDLVARTRVISF